MTSFQNNAFHLSGLICTAIHLTGSYAVVDTKCDLKFLLVCVHTHSWTIFFSLPAVIRFDFSFVYVDKQSSCDIGHLCDPFVVRMRCNEQYTVAYSIQSMDITCEWNENTVVYLIVHFTNTNQLVVTKHIFVSFKRRHFGFLFHGVRSSFDRVKTIRCESKRWRATYRRILYWQNQYGWSPYP